MGKVTRILAIAAASLTLIAVEAEAARLGGGKSVGRSSNNVTQRQALPAQTPSAPTQQAQPSAAKPAPSAQPPQPARNRWLAPLAGLAAGLGLAALASHLGFGEGLASLMLVLLLAFAAVVVVRMVMARRAQRPGLQPAYSSAGVGNEAAVRYTPMSDAPSAGAASVAPAAAVADPAQPVSASWRIPEGFDVDGFIRNAKVQFIRLQAAYDTANLSDLREFTTPELFAELRMQISERGQSPNQTDVVQLDSELLGIETDGETHLASVRFHGLIRESDGAAAEPFDEVWNLEKPVSGQSGWMLAGIQQLH